MGFPAAKWAAQSATRVDDKWSYMIRLDGRKAGWSEYIVLARPPGHQSAPSRWRTISSPIHIGGLREIRARQIAPRRGRLALLAVNEHHLFYIYPARPEDIVIHFRRLAKALKCGRLALPHDMITIFGPACKHQLLWACALRTCHPEPKPIRALSCSSWSARRASG